MDDIARTARVSRATVYAHFPGMSDIVTAILDDLYSAGDHIFDQLAEMPEWTTASVRAWLHEVAMHYHTERHKVRFSGLPGIVIDRDESTRRHRGYIDTIIAGRSWLGLERSDAEQRAFMLILLVESFFIARLTGNSPLPQGYPFELLCETVHALGPSN